MFKRPLIYRNVSPCQTNLFRDTFQSTFSYWKLSLNRSFSGFDSTSLSYKIWYFLYFFSFDVLRLQLYFKIFDVLVYLIFFFSSLPLLKNTHHKTIKWVVTFALSHVNLIINKDFLVQNIQIFIYFNYS